MSNKRYLTSPKLTLETKLFRAMDATHTGSLNLAHLIEYIKRVPLSYQVSVLNFLKSYSSHSSRISETQFSSVYKAPTLHAQIDICKEESTPISYSSSPTLKQKLKHQNSQRDKRHPLQPCKIIPKFTINLEKVSRSPARVPLSKYLTKRPNSAGSKYGSQLTSLDFGSLRSKPRLQRYDSRNMKICTSRISLNIGDKELHEQVVKENKIDVLAKKFNVKNKVDIRAYEERQLDGCTFKPKKHSKLKQFLTVGFKITQTAPRLLDHFASPRRTNSQLSYRTLNDSYQSTMSKRNSSQESFYPQRSELELPINHHLISQKQTTPTHRPRGCQQIVALGQFDKQQQYNRQGTVSPVPVHQEIQSNFTLTSSNLLKNNETPRLTTFNLSNSSFDLGSQLKTGRSLSSSIVSESVSPQALTSTLACGYAERHSQKQKHILRSHQKLQRMYLTQHLRYSSSQSLERIQVPLRRPGTFQEAVLSPHTLQNARDLYRKCTLQEEQKI